MDANGKPEVGDCVQINTGKQWNFEGAVGRLERVIQGSNNGDIAIVRIDDGYLARCPLGKLIYRHPMACAEE